MGMCGGGMPPEHNYPKPDGVTYPLAGSCCGCKKDATADPKAKMNRCGGCKLVRLAIALYEPPSNN